VRARRQGLEAEAKETAAFAKRLRETRQARGLSQRAFADVGVSYAYISRLEAGARRPSVRVVRRLAAKLGVSAEWLETGREPNRWESFTGEELRELAAALKAGSDSPTAESLRAEIAVERRRRSRRG